MRSIAYLTSADLVAGHPDLRADAFELDHQLHALVPACASRGMRLDLQVWRSDALLKQVENGHYDAVVVGTTWDYHDHWATFCDRLDRFALSVLVLNPPAVVRWNADKTYLRELAQAGVPSVPTFWADRVDADTVRAAHDALDADHLICKPVVGAGAVRQVQVRRGHPLPPASECPPGGALVQPFLPSIRSEGELSFVFCGGRFSHALLKAPARGDYRVQSVYGGVERTYTPSAEELATARSVLDAVPQITADGLLLARVDMVRDRLGHLVLMELELIEPYLYPLQGPDLGDVFAESLSRLLGRP